MTMMFGFDSPEEMVEATRAATARANTGLAPGQRILAWGMHWVRREHGVLIFGKVDTLAEVRIEEIECGATVDEADYTANMVETRYADGYLYGNCCSQVVPDGEHGFTHRAAVWPIEQATYEAARVAGWDPSRMPLDRQLDVAIALMAYRGYVERMRSGE